MTVWLRATDGAGKELGKIEISINRGPGGEIVVWEWHSAVVKLGGRAYWKHDGHRFRLELQDHTGHVLFTLSDGPPWVGPPGSHNEPPRPWFGPGRATAGLGSRTPPGPPPHPVVPGFNWTYTGRP